MNFFHEFLADALTSAWIAVKRKYPHISEKGRPEVWFAEGEFAEQMEKEGCLAYAFPDEWAIAIKMPYWKNFAKSNPEWCFRSLVYLLIHEFLHLAKPEASEKEIKKETREIFIDLSETPFFRELREKWR